MSTSGRTKYSYIPTLDGWRAVAILAVVFSHLHLPAKWYESMSQYGALGVDLFFAISGLLITSRLAEEYQQHETIDLRSFYVRRAFRILPAAMFYLTVILALRPFGYVDYTLQQIAAAILFFRNYVFTSVEQDWFTGHYWSLSVEEHFYLLWPLGLFWIKPDKAIRIVPLLALAIAVWRTLDSHFHWVSAAGLIGNPSRTDYRLDGILWGCFVALLINLQPARQILSRILSSWHALLAIAAILLLAVVRAKGYLAVIPILMAVVVATTVIHPQAWLGRILEQPALRFVGRISYSLYLWQQIFLTPPALRKLGALQTLPIALVAAFGAAYISYRFIEVPCIRFGRKVAERRSSLDSRVRVTVA